MSAPSPRVQSTDCCGPRGLSRGRCLDSDVDENRAGARMGLDSFRKDSGVQIEAKVGVDLL